MVAPAEHNGYAFKRRAALILHGRAKSSVFDDLQREGLSDVVVPEGRPTLSTGKANAAALQKRGLTPVIIADNSAGFLFFRDWVRAVWLAVIEQAPDGATAEIGSLPLAVLARRHGVPVRVVPAARYPQKFKRLLGTADDLLNFNGRPVVDRSYPVYAPLFEWIPAQYLPPADAADQGKVT